MSSNIVNNSRPNLVAADDYASVVSIVLWIFLACVLAAVVARLSTRWITSKITHIDDYLIIAATAFSIGYVSTISVEAANGLGRQIYALKPRKLRVFQKSNYASGFLYVAVLCCAKLSILQLLHALSPVVLHKRLILGIGSVVAVWAVTAIFVVAFQCHLPKAWEILGRNCINKLAFWTYFEVVNIFTDALLILLPAGIIWRIQASGVRKAVVIGCFAGRISVIVASVARLVYLRYMSSAIDQTFDAWRAEICAVIVESLSIIAPCIPYLKPFFESLESGMLDNDTLRREGMNELRDASTQSTGAAHKSRSSNVRSASTGRKKSPRLEQSDYNHAARIRNAGSDRTVISADSRADEYETNFDWNVGSQSSQSRFIRKTTTLTMTSSAGT